MKKPPKKHLPKRRLFHSYTSRLTLLYALIFSASTLFLFYFFYLFTIPHMTRQVDDTIQADIQGLAERYDRDGLPGLYALINDRVGRQQAQATFDAIYLLTNFKLQPLAGNLDRWPKQTTTLAGDWLEFALVVNQRSGETHRVRAKRFRLPGGDRRYYGLLVGRDINQLTEARQLIMRAFTWGLAVMLLLALAGGVLLGRRTVRKIERINQTTRNIMSGDLSRRVPLTGHNDDFDQVAENLNRMLDRIQRLMEDIRRVSDGIAHDLRTPLTRLRQHLEQARRQADADSGSAQSLDGSIQEADSLLSTFNALLRIARVEAGQINFGASQIDFHALIEDIVEFYEPLAEEKEQRLVTGLETGIKSWGDRDLIFQAVANLVENAVKYTPERGCIRISLHRGDDGDEQNAVIAVADNGPGIPESERENVFRRFYRLDQSRSSIGNGLGLSMALAVATMHDGGIELCDNQPGLKCVLTVPLTAKPEIESSVETQPATISLATQS